MVVLRAASNYDQIPLRADGQPILGKDGQPLTAMQDILLGFDDASSAYAAYASAAPVIRMFELRAAQWNRMPNGVIDVHSRGVGLRPDLLAGPAAWPSALQ